MTKYVLKIWTAFKARAVARHHLPEDVEASLDGFVIAFLALFVVLVEAESATDVGVRHFRQINALADIATSLGLHAALVAFLDGVIPLTILAAAAVLSALSAVSVLRICSAISTLSAVSSLSVLSSCLILRLRLSGSLTVPRGRRRQAVGILRRIC